MSDPSEQDVTVLRMDPSVSTGPSVPGSGEVDPPRVLKQRFVLEEKLGSGGMGSVFKAKDLRKVEARDRQPFLAVKVLNNDFREHPEAFIALQREAAKSQVLSHPNVVSIFDFDKDGDVPFIIMELLEGQELADLIRAYPNGLPDEMVWRVIDGMCAGLQHAHEEGIVHADFKPGNVYVSPDNVVKVLDFGIARAVRMNQQYGEDTVFDPARLAALTPAYASREMLNGDNPEVRDDIYSLGVVLYLALTGRHPYGRTSAADAAKEGMRPERPKRLSRRQWRMLERCLRFHRAERPASVELVRHHLLGAAPWRSRSALAAAAAFALALGINALVDDAQLTEVKAEVRQSTLIDAEVGRIGRLLQAPAFDAAWEQQLVEGFAALAKVEGSAQTLAALRERLPNIYAQHVAGLDEIDVALSALSHGEQLFGPLPPAATVVHDKMVKAILVELDAPRLDVDWVDGVGAQLSRLAESFPRSSALPFLQVEYADWLEVQLLASLEKDAFLFAESAVAALTPIMFDAETLDRLSRKVADAEVEFAVATQQRLSQDNARSFANALTRALGRSCLYLDVNQVGSLLREWVARDASLEAQGRKRIAERLGHCMGQLAELDDDRAQVLRDKARAEFGPMPELDTRAEIAGEMS